MKSGRILIPAYHSYFHYDDGELSHAHVLISDDFGKSWRMGGEVGGWDYLTNENQLVELTDGTVFMNSRGFLKNRIRSFSTDQGETWSDPELIPELVEPLEGCEGSTIRHPLNGWLFFSGANNFSPYRYNMSIFISKDEAKSWQSYIQIDPGRSAYSALTVLQDNSVGLLYERSNLTDLIFVPTHISFLIIWSPHTNN